MASIITYTLDPARTQKTHNFNREGLNAKND